MCLIVQMIGHLGQFQRRHQAQLVVVPGNVLGSHCGSYLGTGAIAAELEIEFHVTI